MRRSKTSVPFDGCVSALEILCVRDRAFCLGLADEWVDARGRGDAGPGVSRLPEDCEECATLGRILMAAFRSSYTVQRDRNTMSFSILLYDSWS